jgi:hypothetical protein
VARRVLVLAVLAAVVGLSVQAPFKPAPRLSAVSNCPTGAFDLAGPGLSPTATVTCVGWSGPDFESGTAPGSVLVRDASPRLGEPCRDLHYYRVAFVQVGGAVRGTFSIFGRMSQGSMAVPEDQVRLINTSDAYVADVQLGSYETSSANGNAPLRCDIAPTYHLYCPHASALDQPCYTWLARPLRAAARSDQTMSALSSGTIAHA